MSYHSDYDAHLDNYGNPGIFDDERDFEEEAYNQRLLDTGDAEGARARGAGHHDKPRRHPDAYEYGEPWGPDNPAPDSPWGKAQQVRKEARDSVEYTEADIVCATEVWREHARLAFASDSPEKLGDRTARERIALREHRLAGLARTLSAEDRTASGLTQCQHGLYVCADCDY